MALPVNRLAPPTIESDRNSLVGLQSLADYAPRNPAYSLAELSAREAELAAIEAEELKLQLTLDAIRTRVIAASHAFHDAMLGAKAEVIAQYGADSSAVQAVGLKRKSARRRPARRAADPAA